MANLRTNWQRRFGASIFLFLTAALLTACGEKTIAETDSESEANMMYDILYSNQLNAEKQAQTGEKTGWKIVVNDGWIGDSELAAATATQILNDHGLPRPKTAIPSPASAYGMESPEEAKKRQNREKEAQIENLVYNLPGVIRVSVIVAQPNNDILSLEKTPPTATVSIVQTEMEPKFTSDNVKNLVAGSVANLKPENVSVGISQQLLREVPMERLNSQRRTNKLLALGGGLIALLVAVLGTVWYTVKKRRREAEAEQLTDGDAPDELEGDRQYALNAADDEDY